MYLIDSRKYEKKKQLVLKYIKRKGRIDSYEILNEVDIDYDTLKRIIEEIKNKRQV